MKNAAIFTVVVSLFLVSLVVSFAPSTRAFNGRMTSRSKTQSTTSFSAIPVDIAHVEMTTQLAVPTMQQQQSALTDGVRNYVNNLPSKFGETSSMTVSLKDRPPPPTKEELAAKKRNFNLWFWGGGFVAPFLATFYYFGFKFWEK
ncbi:hypothetical protein IV203_021255 [Nitzschia inconspicua]|uniref:Transmembrane protein n=1 Tax=Nitzschia inconspicua TaxID=303405 RepID=A0A9K3KGU3_9STRA|nr:hypothetical protein IV203_021255 [Nitzschia inconspicua]